MDGPLSVVRNTGDHHHRLDDSSSKSSSQRVVVVAADEGSNGSSGGTPKEESDSEFPGPKERRHSQDDEETSSPLAPSPSGDDAAQLSHHHHHHRHHHHKTHQPSTKLHNHLYRRRNNARANYCQFETPADESRGTFPDDFDEEIFINSGQLVETVGGGRSVVGQFDEEMEENQEDPLMHPINLDTADHSESSDMEDALYLNPPETSSSSAATATSKNNSRRNANGSSSSRQPHGETGSELLQPSTDFLEERLLPDLTTDNAPPPPPPEEDEDEDGDVHFVACDEEPASSSSSSASPMRKRKGRCDHVLVPVKKAVKEVNMHHENLYSPINLDSPDLVRMEEECSGGSGDGMVGKDKTKCLRQSKECQPSNLAGWLETFLDWNDTERLIAIDQLINHCESTQVRHMMKVIEPQFQRDFISLLPKELALYVLSFLDPKDLLKAAQTCRYWRVLCDDNLLWREKCKEAGVGHFNAMAQRIHTRRNRGNQPSCPSTCNLGINGNPCGGSCGEQLNTSRWKSAYLRQHNVEGNWRFQPMRPTKILKGHDDHVITCLQFSGNRIVSGSDDNTLKVWSASNGKCLRTLIGHTGGVWSSQMSGVTIVSGSTDRTLRVWDADNGTCVHTLYGHTSTVRCMHLCGRKVVSGSRDATLRVWDVDTGECLHVLVGHMAAVRCVQYNGTIVVSGAYDYMVRVWDVEKEECLHQLSGHTNRVYSLQFDGIHVVSGSLDTSIRVWDVKTGVCKHTLMGHQSLTSGMELRDNLLVSGNADSTVKIWDINTGQCLLTLSGPNKHLSAVTCLQLINKFVITSSDDGTVKLWDIRTGEFVRNLVTLPSGGSGGVVWRIRASETKLVCAVGSRNGTEETKLLVLDFDVEPSK